MTNGYAQHLSKAQSLREITVPIRGLQFSDANFDDLKPLEKIIGDARIVVIGEQTHGEGSTFAAKARLVRFLHEKMGFDVMAIESGFYDANKAWQAAKAGENLGRAAEGSLFYMYTKSAEIKPLFDYIDERKNGARPFYLTGMDSQLSGKLSAEKMTDDLEAFLIRNNSALVKSPDWIWAKNLTSASIKKFKFTLTKEELARYQAFVGALADEAGKFKNTPTADILDQNGFWVNILRGLHFQADKAGDSTGNIRDTQMAENVEWLAENPYKGKRMIIWAHNFHAFRDFSHAYEKQPEGGLSRKKSMGTGLAAVYGEKLFVIGTTGREGSYMNYEDGKTLAVPAIGADRLESGFDSGLECGLVPLRHLPKSAEWLAEEQQVGLVDFIPLHVRLPELMDALLYIKKSYPTKQ